MKTKCNICNFNFAILPFVALLWLSNGAFGSLKVSRFVQNGKDSSNEVHDGDWIEIVIEPEDSLIELVEVTCVTEDNHLVTLGKVSQNGSQTTFAVGTKRIG